MNTMMSENTAPEIAASTQKQRRDFIENRFRCISDCDQCGICAIFHNRDPLLIYQDYIEGKRSFEEISEDYKRR